MAERTLKIIVFACLNVLIQWVEQNHFNLIYLKANYNNSNYQLKDKNSVTREVLITNY